MAQLKVTQIRSVIGRPLKQKRTIEALGLGRPGRSRVVEENAAVRGMLRVVAHLVEIQPANGQG